VEHLRAFRNGRKGEKAKWRVVIKKNIEQTKERTEENKRE
jgi:hypothetical protein